MTERERVFVYGTLMPGASNAAIADVAGLVAAAPASVHGFRLYHLEPEGYPAVVPGPGQVRGTVLTLGGSLDPLDALEAIHEHPPLYRRIRCTPDGQSDAWIYVYARPERLTARGVTWIPSGRWTDRHAFDT